MLKLVVDVGVPILVFVAMVLVGIELTTDDFRRVALQPWKIMAATAGQLLLLPVLGWLITRFLPQEPAVALGILLVTACPSGTVANVYTLMGRRNLALSVTLTMVSCLAAVLTTPLTLAVLQPQRDESSSCSVPLGLLIIQLFVLLVLPGLAGMSGRCRWPDIASRHRHKLQCVGGTSLALLLGLVIVSESE